MAEAGRVTPAADNGLRVRQETGCLWLTLARPAVHNALNDALLHALQAALDAAATDATVRVAVIEGSGGAAFCAGIDLGERRGLDVQGMGRQSAAVLRLVQTVAESPFPVIAAIDGWCLGAGLELALGCDLRLASDRACLGFPEMALGTYPGGGGAVLLPRVVGPARALDLLLSTERLGAAAALAAGLLSAVFPTESFDGAVRARAAAIAALSPTAVRALRASLRQTPFLPLPEALALDQRLRRPLDASRDHQEGLSAQRERRAPRFTGE